MKTKHSLTFYIKYFIREVKNRFSLKRTPVYIPIGKPILSHSYWPYPETIKEAEKLRIIGNQFLTNKMTLKN